YHLQAAGGVSGRCLHLPPYQPVPGRARPLSRTQDGRLMDWSIFQQYGPMLLRGFGLTILCWLLGTVLGMALGLVIALIQRYAPRPVGWIMQAYIEIIRGTPFL